MRLPSRAAQVAKLPGAARALRGGAQALPGGAQQQLEEQPEGELLLPLGGSQPRGRQVRGARSSLLFGL